MNNNVSKAILDYLLLNGNLGLPGIGTFRVSKGAWSLSLGDKSLTPPSGILSFSEDIIDEKGLISYLANRLDISIRKAENALKKYVQRHINALLNYDKTELPGIGVLQRITATDAIEFKEEDASFDIRNSFLPAVSLSPIDRRDVLHASETIQKTSVEIKVQPTKNLENTISAANSVSTPTVANTSAQADYKAYSEYYEKDEKNWVSYVIWGLLLVGLLLFMAYLFRDCSCFFGNGTDNGNSASEGIVDSSEYKLHSQEYKDSVYTAQLSNAKGHSNFEEYRSLLTQDIVDSGCVIIVGAFKKARNATRMRDRIIRAGFQPYTEISGEFTRTGILFDCLEHDLVDYIQQIRRKFDAYSWYLQPDLEVKRLR